MTNNDSTIMELYEVSYWSLKSNFEMNRKITKIPNNTKTQRWDRKTLSDKLIFYYILNLSQYIVNENHTNSSYTKSIV